MSEPAPTPPPSRDLRKGELLLMDAVLACTLLFLPNLMLFFIFLPSFTPPSITAWSQPVMEPWGQPSFRHSIMGAGLNLLFLGLLIWLRHYVLLPIIRSLSLIQAARRTIMQEAPAARTSRYYNFRLLAGDIVRFTSFVQDHYRNHQELGRALEETRRLLQKATEQQQQMFDTAAREISTQYKAVLNYAQHLDEYIEQHLDDRQLRFDFDDVCESSFYLRLMAGAMHLLYQPAPCTLKPVCLATLMQDTLLALTPTLDRRAMKLSSAEFSLGLVAQSDYTTLIHVVWMMLLGLVRYAEDESSLRLRCFQSQSGGHAWLSMVVSELSPGQMTPEERAQHFARQLNSTAPHMFAETLRTHASLQLAELLLARVEGKITITSLSPTACEISLILPIHLNSTAQS